MNDLLNEKVGLDDVAKIGNATGRIAKVGFDKAAGAVGDTWNYLTKKQGYKDASTQATADKVKQLGTLDSEIAKAQIEKSTLRPKVNPETHRDVTQNIKDLTANRANLAKEIKGGKRDLPELPAPDAFTRGQTGTRLATGGTALYQTGKAGYNYATQDVDNPNHIPAAPAEEELPPIGDTGKAPELKSHSESVDFKDILKLAGLKPITERDVTSGLTKAKPIMTLVENTNLSECGGMGMSSMPNTPASLSINATAGSGEEVAGMLASILQLAGLKQVDSSMMPEVEPMPMMKAMDIMTANPSDETGSDMEFDEPMGDDGIEIDVVDVMPDSMNSGADDGMSSDEEEKTKEGFEDATTKPNPTEMPGYGNWEQKFQRLSGDDMANVPARSGDNPLKRSPAVKESVAEADPVTHGLFKAYEAFKNGQ